MHGLQKDSVKESVAKQPLDELTDKEKEVLKLFCTEMTYKEIAAQLGLSSRTIENHKDALCNKLDLNSRIGLAIYAIKNNLVKI